MTNYFRHRVEEALGYLREALGPYVIDIYVERYANKYIEKINNSLSFSGDRHGLPSYVESREDILAHLDTQKILKLIRSNRGLFRPDLDKIGLAWVDELSGWRDLWAHESAMNDEVFYRVTDTMYFLIRQLKDEYNSEQIEAIVDEVHARQDSTSSSSLVIEINGKRFEENTLKNLYKVVLTHLVINRHIRQAESHLPISSGDKRYVIARDPVHPSGKPFFRPIEYEGYYMETNTNIRNGLKFLSMVVEACGLQMLELES